MKGKIAFITGITGQDGYYLSSLLLSKGYEVHGLVRSVSTSNMERLNHIHTSDRDRLHLHVGDILDSHMVRESISKIGPDEVYHLAAQSHVHASFDNPMYAIQVITMGALNVLEAVKKCGKGNIRFYNASTSEMFGKVQEIPQTESTPFYPRSPYGIGKLAAHWLTINYREAYGMFACNGILFNHESPMRGVNFVTRKITRALARNEKIVLGNLDAVRDWGHAADYVYGMWLMLQADKPDDYILATGVSHSVREFLEEALKASKIPYGGCGNIYSNNNTGSIVAEVDDKFKRPAEVDILIGDASKAKEKLGWVAHTTFEKLVQDMVDHDFNLVIGGGNEF